MNQIERILTPITLVGEWKSMLFPKLAADLAIPVAKFWQSENNVLRLHFTKPQEVNIVEPLVP